MTEELTAQATTELLRLLNTESIRNLKLRYAHLMDKLDIDALAELFTDDAVCDFGPYGKWTGKEVIRQNYHEAMAQVVSKPFGSLHHICNHWVEMRDETSAVGRCYLIDIVTERAADENPVLWYAMYDEEYRRVDGVWKISFSCIQFLWPERHVTETVLNKFPPETVD
jgi:hypothetical protein